MIKKTINVEVIKSPTESTASLLRRFTRRVQGAGIIQTVKGGRFSVRKNSPFKRKKNALRRIKKWEENERLRKLGKIK